MAFTETISECAAQPESSFSAFNYHVCLKSCHGDTFANFPEASDVLELLKRWFNSMNQRTRHHLTRELVFRACLLHRRFGVPVCIKYEEHPHNVLIGRLSSLFDLSYIQERAMDIVPLIHELSLYEAELTQRRHFYTGFVRDNFQEKYRNTMHRVILPFVHSVVGCHDWTALGQICGLSPILRSSRPYLFIYKQPGDATSAHKNSVVRLAPAFIYTLTRDRVFAALYVNVLLQRAVVSKALVTDRCTSISLSIVHLIKLAMFGIFRHDDYSVLCLAALTFIGWGETTKAQELLDLNKKIQKRHSDMDFAPYHKAVCAFIRYLTWSRRQFLDKSSSQETARSLLSAAKLVGLTDACFLVQAAVRVFARSRTLDDEALYDICELFESEPSCLGAVLDSIKHMGGADDLQFVLKRVLPQPTSQVHEADRVWIRWSELRVADPLKYGGNSEAGPCVVRAMVPFLDYAENRADSKAWAVLWHGLKLCSDQSWGHLWAERSGWWPSFHAVPIDERAVLFREESLKILSGHM